MSHTWKDGHFSNDKPKPKHTRYAQRLLTKLPYFAKQNPGSARRISQATAQKNFKQQGKARRKKTSGRTVYRLTRYRGGIYKYRAAQ